MQSKFSSMILCSSLLASLAVAAPNEPTQSGASQNSQNQSGFLDTLLGTDGGGALNDSSSALDTSKIKTYELGAVEITAPQLPDSNPTTTIISKKDIENSGSLDVGQALRFTPGVFFLPVTNAYANTINIRGFNEEETGFYFDGIPINDIYAGNSSGDTDLFSFFTFGLSEIQISKGYTSPAFSAGKMGGAMNMVSSIPTKDLEINAKYTFISNNENRFDAQVGRNFGTDYFQLTFSHMERKSLNYSYDYSGEGPTPIPNSYRKAYMFMGKYGWVINDNHEYSVNFYHQHMKKMLDNSARGSYPYYDKTAVYVLGDSKFSDFFSLNSKVWYHMNLNQSGNQNFANGSAWSGKYDDYTIGLTETAKIDFSENQNLKVGILVKNDKHEATDWNADFAKRDWKVLNSSVFSEYALRVNSVFRFALSGSYDRHDGLNVKNRDAVSTTKMDNKHLWGWTLHGIAYAQPVEPLLLHANVGHKTNLPKIRGLYGRDDGSLVANDDLTTESLINYELGATFSYASTQVGLTGFYNDINNMIVATQVDSSLCDSNTCYQYENAKDGYSWGAEAFVKQGFFSDKLTLGANYSYIQRKSSISKRRGEGTKGDTREFTTHPRQNINISALIAPRKEYDIGLNGSVQTSRWAYNSTENDYVKLPTVVYFDLVANYYLKENLKLSVGAYNLFDKNYNYESSDYDGASAGGLPGRRVFAGFEYHYSR